MVNSYASSNVAVDPGVGNVHHNIRSEGDLYLVASRIPDVQQSENNIRRSPGERCALVYIIVDA